MSSSDETTGIPAWPRTYGPSKASKLGGSVVAVVCAVVAVVMGVHFSLQPHPVLFVQIVSWLMVACLLAFAAIVPLLVNERLSFYGNRIVRHRPFSVTREVERSYVGSYRIENRTGRRLVLFGRDHNRKLFSGALGSTPDAELVQWLEGVPAASVVKVETARRAFVARELPNATPEQVERALRRIQRTGFGATLLAIALVGLLTFWPRYADALIIANAAAPLFALWLVWRFDPVVTFDTRGDSPLIDTYALYSMPACGLGLRAVLDHDELLEYRPLLVPALAVLAAILVMTVLVDRERSVFRVLSHVFFSAFYAAGIIALANARMDSAPATRHALVIRAKEQSDSRHEGGSLMVDDWRLGQEPLHLKVSKTIYREAMVGGSLLVEERPGALGAAWIGVVEHQH